MGFEHILSFWMTQMIVKSQGFVLIYTIWFEIIFFLPDLSKRPSNMIALVSSGFSSLLFLIWY